MAEESRLRQVTKSPKTLGELFRFGIVGVAHNLTGYLLYLLITWMGVDPKIAVAVLYPIGTLASYFLNKHYTFEHQGAVKESLTKFIVMHGAGYALNLAIIYVGYDILGYPHQLVQLFAMGFLAATFFVVSKFLIFVQPESRDTRTAE